MRARACNIYEVVARTTVPMCCLHSMETQTHEHLFLSSKMDTATQTQSSYAAVLRDLYERNKHDVCPDSCYCYYRYYCWYRRHCLLHPPPLPLLLVLPTVVFALKIPKSLRSKKVLIIICFQKKWGC